MRRGLLLAGVWLLGALFAVACSFAAVRHVASGVTRSSGAEVAHVVDRDITTIRRPPPPQTPKPRARAHVASPIPQSAPPPVISPPPSPPPSPSPPATAPPPTVPATVAPTATPPNNTMTTSEGGTVWTRCSGTNTIVYVAAVPRTGYQRITDIEDASGIEQQFDNGTRRSTVRASCSDGVVHAQVEEETLDD